MGFTDEGLPITDPSWGVHHEQYWIDMIERLGRGSFWECMKDRGSPCATSDFGLITDLSSRRDDYIRWYWNITLVYIGNLARRDAWTFGYQSAGVDRQMMFFLDIHSARGRCHDYMGVGETAIISDLVCCTPSHHGIQQTFAVQQSRHRPWEPVPECGARGVNRGACRLPGDKLMEDALLPPHLGGRGQANHRHRRERGGGSGEWGLRDLGSYVPPDPFDSADLDVPTFSLGTSYAPPPPSVVGLSFDAPPPPSTAGSSVPHMLISHASSSDLDDQGDNSSDDVAPAQQLGVGHHVRNVEEDDEDDNDADEDYDASSESDDDNNPNDEEDDMNTLVNPLSSITVNK
ncbi:hypothetical protein M9H77_21199 [Catharanthus roseus]|uniref:Uncharacterized protein n=1 Tax=Catharanthus roseus TaxID=4058 RepID=A0ACC0AQX3_CATRO|nr:hypothetical protein M9H77_21199 [Catharanthus roseus]